MRLIKFQTVKGETVVINADRVNGFSVGEKEGILIYADGQSWQVKGNIDTLADFLVNVAKGYGVWIYRAI